MKKILFTLLLVPALATSQLSAGGLDFHFGIGSGGEPLKEKEAYAIKGIQQGGTAITADLFLGFGWTFAEVGPLGFAAGGEYQASPRGAWFYQIGQTSGQGYASFMMDQYVNGYIKMKFKAIKAFPLALTANMGIGFRTNAVGFGGSGSVSAGGAAGSAGNFERARDVAVGYKMGLRATLGFMYLGMDYTIFPTVWKNSSKANPQTFTITGGFGWMV